MRRIETPFASAVFNVRDYECDMQGIVNNANYLHYAEHARHELLRKLGLDFSKTVQEKKYLVAVQQHIRYLQPLRPGDSFVVKLGLQSKKRTKVVFYQEIILHNTQKLTTQISTTAACMAADGQALRVAEYDWLWHKFGF